MATGRAVWYEPGVKVSHHVAAMRLRRQWFRQRYYAQGLSDAKMKILHEGLHGHGRARAAAREVVGLLRSPSQLVAPLRRPDEPGAFTAHCLAMIRLGHVAGLLGAV
jgi:hypothetical protein